MDELTVIDQFLDEREFRNYIAALLERCGYIEVHIEDTRTADGRSDNDNDLLVQKEGNTYTGKSPAAKSRKPFRISTSKMLMAGS